jgi:uncharacterized protein YbjT (DUF2867 family)
MSSHAQPAPIAVLGCTGTVGSALVHELAAQNRAVVGLLRSPNRTPPAPPRIHPSSIAYAVTDATDVEQLTEVLRGTEALFLCTATAPDQVEVETRAITAARRAHVRRIVKLSAPVVSAPAHVEVASWHRHIEGVLQQSGLDHACLRPRAFMQNWVRQAAVIAQTRTLLGSAGRATRNYVDARDVAAIAARLLCADHPLEGACLQIDGPQAFNNADIAAKLTELTVAPVHSLNLTPEAHEQALMKHAGLPAWLARHLVELEVLAVQVAEPRSGNVEALLGAPARTMDAFLHEHASAFRLASHIPGRAPGRQPPHPEPR